MNVLFKRPFHAANKTLSRHEGHAHPHTAGRVRAVVGGVLVADGLVGLKDPLDPKNSLTGILGSIGGALLGLVLIGVGLFLDASAAELDATTTGTITSVPGSPSSAGGGGRECSLSAGFEVDGQAYVASSGPRTTSSCHHWVGERIEITYSSADPDKNSIGTSWRNVGAPFLVLGALALLGSVFTLLVGLTSILFGLHLVKSGRRTMAENPQAVDDDRVVEEAKRAVTNLLKRRAAGSPIPNESFDRIAGGPAGGLLGNLLDCPPVEPRTIAPGAKTWPQLPQ